MNKMDPSNTKDPKRNKKAPSNTKDTKRSRKVHQKWLKEIAESDREFSKKE